MNDHEIVALYWERSENAIAETERKYGRYCHYVAYQILRDDHEAQEVVNDVCYKAWQTIPPSRPTNLKAYVGMMASQLAVNRYDEKTAAKRGGGELPLVLEELAECIADRREDSSTVDEIALRDTLNRFLGSLPKRTRNLFVRRYWYASSVADIAKDYGMKESNVRMTLLRARNKLKQALIKEGFTL